MARGALFLCLLLLTAPTARAQDQAGIAELILRLQVLEEELRGLRGEVETQRFRQQELEARVRELTGAPAPASPAAPGSRDDPALGGTGTLGGTSGGPELALDTPTQTPGATAAPVTPSGAGLSEGMALLQAGRYADARTVLNGFVDANEQAGSAPEAAFWSAETLFFEGRYDEAASAFAANYRRFGEEAPRAPDSLLKVAMALNQLGDASRACQALDELGRRHGATLGRSLESEVRRERDRAGCG